MATASTTGWSRNAWRCASVAFSPPFVQNKLCFVAGDPGLVRDERAAPLKALLAIPLILVNTGLFLVSCYLMAVAFAGGALAFPTLWWVAPLSGIAALTYVAALIVVGAETMGQLRSFRDPQKVLACSLQSLGWNLVGVVLGVLLILLLLFSEFFLVASH